MSEKKYKIDTNHVYDFKRGLKKYDESCKNIRNTKFDLGFPTLQQNLRGLRRAEVLSILAKPGIGKSILGFNFGYNFLRTSESGLLIVFSLEMAIEGLVERALQIELEQSGEAVENAFVKHDVTFIDKARAISSYNERLFFVSHSVDVYDIPEYVRYIKDITEKEVGIVMIDYVGIMPNRYHKKEYDRITDNMMRIYAYAKSLDVGIINISQIPREFQKMEQAVGKGSGEVENSSDFGLHFSLVTSKNVWNDTERGMLHHVETSKKPFSLMRIEPTKTRRGSRNSKKIVYVLFNHDTIRIFEFNNQLLI